MKPLLADQVELAQLKYPVMVSPKLDGIRCMIVENKAISRAMKPIKNNYIREELSKPDYNFLDGELIVGKPNAKDVFAVSTSAVMTIKGEPDFKFYIFDHMEDLSMTFKQRYSRLKTYKNHRHIKIVPHIMVENEEELLSAEDAMVNSGFEGLMIRSPEGKYKFGRSTVKEGILLKLKRFLDSEAEIVGFQELMHNGNETTINELGYKDHSSHKAGMVPMGVLGAFLVKDIKTGIEFKIGTGFTSAQRQAFWHDREALENKIVKYKYLPVGVKDAPRHPVYLGFRDKIDM